MSRRGWEILAGTWRNQLDPLVSKTAGEHRHQVSPLGLGTVKIGRDQGLKYPNRFKLPSDREIRALFEEARTLGINFIDTAPAYGTSEEKIGKLLPDRQDWIIGTKVGEGSAPANRTLTSPALIPGKA